MTLCKPCQSEGREQAHHHFLEPEDGGPPVPVCRWHFRGIPHPSMRGAAIGRAPIEAKEINVEHERAKFDESKLRALHARGLIDAEIGKELGRSRVTVFLHRRKLGLPAHGRTGRPRGHYNKGPGPTETLTAAPIKTSPTSASSNGTAALVLIRVELLDAMWAQLQPEEKAQLINHLIPAEARA